ncbi:hypothetical protein [Hydrogenophaga sp. T2]|uniref:hypothetical protein n=1 Tax=Hydrogenophaga sp. T2 TaxID=3132823 RepID=UPI003CF1A7C3
MKPYSSEPSRDPTLPPVTEFAQAAPEPSLPNGAARLASDVKDVGLQGGQAIQRLVHDTGDLAAQGAKSVRSSAHELRERSMQLREAAASYVRHEPVKSVLLAAAAGAALMGLVTLLGRAIAR